MKALRNNAGALAPFKYYLLLALSLLMLGLLVYTIDFQTFFGHLRQLDFTLLTLVLLVYALSWALRSSRLHLIVGEPLLWTDAFRIQIAGFALNLIYPAKLGDLFMGSFLKQHIGERYQESLASILHLRVLDFLVLIFIGFLSLFFLPLNSVSASLWQGVALGGGLVGMFALGVYLCNRTRLLDAVSRILPVKIDITRIFRNLAAYHTFDRKYWGSLLATQGIWVLEMATCYLIAVQIEPGIGFWAITAALAMGNLMKALPLFPGGLGTYEAGFIFLLTLHGVSFEVAVSLSIIDHMLKKIVNLAVGFPVYLGMERKSHVDLAKKTETR